MHYAVDVCLTYVCLIQEKDTMVSIDAAERKKNKKIELCIQYVLHAAIQHEDPPLFSPSGLKVG